MTIRFNKTTRRIGGKLVILRTKGQGLYTRNGKGLFTQQGRAAPIAAIKPDKPITAEQQRQAILNAMKTMKL